MAFRGKRSLKKSPYHYDSLYGIRTHLDDMTWQEGNLRRSCDVDSMMPSQRDSKIVQAMRSVATSPDAQIDKKLEQAIPSIIDDIVI